MLLHIILSRRISPKYLEDDFTRIHMKTESYLSRTTYLLIVSILNTYCIKYFKIQTSYRRTRFSRCAWDVSISYWFLCSLHMKTKYYRKQIKKIRLVLSKNGWMHCIFSIPITYLCLTSRFIQVSHQPPACPLPCRWNNKSNWEHYVLIIDTTICKPFLKFVFF